MRSTVHRSPPLCCITDLFIAWYIFQTLALRPSIFLPLHWYLCDASAWLLLRSLVFTMWMHLQNFWAILRWRCRSLRLRGQGRSTLYHGFLDCLLHFSETCFATFHISASMLVSMWSFSLGTSSQLGVHQVGASMRFWAILRRRRRSLHLR